jgi:serine-protein kinase ATM
MKLTRAQDQTPAQTSAQLGIGIDMNSGRADEDADRALSAVARKLDKGLSVEYTINELIAEATDPTNLSCMFHGALACLSLSQYCLTDE